MSDKQINFIYHEQNELTKQLEKINNYQTVAKVFKQFSDSNRVRIFWLLCHEEKCVLHIAQMLNMSSPAISHHLKPLKKSGLIVSHRVGKEVYYKAANTTETKLLHQIIEQIMEITCPH